MVDVSRRGFLGQAAVATGIGVAGGLGLHKLMAAPPSGNTPMSMDGVSLAGPMVLHVRDLVSGEVSMMVGAQELVYRDPELVSRLLETAKAATKVEG